MSKRRTSRRRGFTLIELLLAVSLLAIVSTLTYMTFSTVTSAWKRGLALADDIHHGDFMMEQMVPVRVHRSMTRHVALLLKE